MFSPTCRCLQLCSPFNPGSTRRAPPTLPRPPSPPPPPPSSLFFPPSVNAAQFVRFSPSCSFMQTPVLTRLSPGVCIFLGPRRTPRLSGGNCAHRQPDRLGRDVRGKQRKGRWASSSRRRTFNCDCHRSVSVKSSRRNNTGSSVNWQPTGSLRCVMCTRAISRDCQEQSDTMRRIFKTQIPC